MIRLHATIPYILGGAILVAGAYFTVGRRAEQRYLKGQEFEHQGNLTAAIEQYEWAIQAYTPSNEYVSDAVERLREIALDAEVSGTTQTAVEAWQSLVSGLAVIEHIEQPYSSALAEANGHLDDLRGRVSRFTESEE